MKRVPAFAKSLVSLRAMGSFAPLGAPSSAGGSIWDPTAADTLLVNNEFSALDALLRCYVDELRHHEAVDWLDLRASEGHLVVLYHCVRNLVKCSASRVGSAASGGSGGGGEAAAGAATALAFGGAGGGGAGGSVASYTAGWIWRWATGGGGGGGGGDKRLFGHVAGGGGGNGGGGRWAAPAGWSGCRVMGSAEFRRAFCLGVWLLLRCAQDVLAVAAVQGASARGVVYEMMRDKLFGWLLAQFPLSRFPPLARVLADVRELHLSSRSAARASATWCFRTGPSASARFLPWGSHIAFGDPGPQLSAACTRVSTAIAEERERVADLALRRLLPSLTWEALAAAPLSIFLGTDPPPLAPPLAPPPAPLRAEREEGRLRAARGDDEEGTPSEAKASGHDDNHDGGGGRRGSERAPSPLLQPA